MDLKQPLKAGERVAITLVFEDAAKKRFTQEIQAPVNALGAAPGQMKHDAGQGMHKH
jgi:copper(I)-binding protein